jgi:hypothetical protein
MVVVNGRKKPKAREVSLWSFVPACPDALLGTRLHSVHHSTTTAPLKPLATFTFIKFAGTGRRKTLFDE